MSDAASDILDIYSRATARYLGGDLAGSVVDLDAAAALARTAGETSLRLVILAQKSGYLREMGREAEARMLLSEAERLFAEMGETHRDLVLVALRMEQGSRAKAAGDFAGSVRLLREAEELVKRDQWGKPPRSDILAKLASTFLERGNLQEAQRVLLEAVWP